LNYRIEQWINTSLIRKGFAPGNPKPAEGIV
jgi:hypothetical protein